MWLKPKQDNHEVLKNYDDKHLIDLFIGTENQQYLGALYDRYIHQVYAQALHYKLSEDDSKDITIEIYQLLVKYVPKSTIKSFSNWLFILTKNECIRKAKKVLDDAQKFEPLKNTENTDEKFVEFAEESPLYDEDLFANEEIVAQALSQLSDFQRKCIILFFFENKSYKVIADLTGTALNDVKSNIQNGKRNLKKILSNAKSN